MQKTLIVLFFLFLLPFHCYAEVKKIEIKHRAAVDLESQVRELLDEGEKVQAAGSHLLLVADGESLIAAEQLIALLDRPQKNLLIRIRHTEISQQGGSRATINYGNKTEASSTGYRIGTSSKSKEQTLNLVEGGKGMIEVGREIPYTDHWAAMVGRFRGYSESTTYKTITTGFWVHPVKMLGDKVLVDVEPYIADASRSVSLAAPEVDNSHLRTRLQIPVAEWYPLGSHLKSQDQVSQAIVAWRAGNTRSERQLQIRIDPVE